MDRWKAEQERGREKRKIRSKKSKKKEDADAWKARKVAKHCVFPMIWGSGGSKSRLAKAAGAEPAGQMRDENLHAIVARSTFPSQNVQSTPGADHFWQLRCRKSAHRCGAKRISKSKCTKHTSAGPLLAVEMLKSARRCGAKHISKSKCAKHTMVGALLEVEMSKKCTPLWREAHLEVKMLKPLGVRTTFGSSDLEKVHAVVARSTCWIQNVKNTRGSDHFWRFRCRFASLHYTTLHYTTLHYSTLQDITLHYTPLHYITLHYTPVPSKTLNYTTPHYIAPHYITLNDTAPQIDR